MFNIYLLVLAFFLMRRKELLECTDSLQRMQAFNSHLDMNDPSDLIHIAERIKKVLLTEQTN